MLPILVKEPKYSSRVRQCSEENQLFRLSVRSGRAEFSDQDWIYQLCWATAPIEKKRNPISWPIKFYCEDQIMTSLMLSASLLIAMAGAPGDVMPVTQEVVVAEEVPVSGHIAATGHRPTATGHGWLVDWFGPMPQTCYQPRFGCYPGNPRTIHRYPAFHGYYYRAPYNYRHLFEYPWHAQPYESEPLRAQSAEVLIDPTASTSTLQPVPEQALQ